MLDLFFRKYAWTATLALLFAAAWIAAKTVNTLVAVAVRPRPQAELAQVSGPPPRPALPASLDLDAVFRLIGQTPPRPPEEGEGPQGPQSPQNCDDPRAAPVRSEARMQLVATVMADRPRFSLATISDPSTRETHVLGVGDALGAIRLLGLERIRDDRDATGNGFRVVAVVCNGGTKEYIDSDAGGPELAAGPNIGTAPVPMPRPPGGPPSAPVQGVRQLADNQYEIERTTLDQTLSDLNKIATQARIVPSFQNGVANGFKLFSIQPGSLYASIGIENGDVIQRVNGYELNSPEKALELYQKLREGPGPYTIDILRSGVPVQKRYSVR
jgi:general secretion pathway protein C